MGENDGSVVVGVMVGDSDGVGVSDTDGTEEDVTEGTIVDGYLLGDWDGDALGTVLGSANGFSLVPMKMLGTALGSSDRTQLGNVDSNAQGIANGKKMNGSSNRNETSLGCKDDDGSIVVVGS